MRDVEAVSSVEVPENVKVQVEGRVVTVEGEKGTLVRNFSHAPVSIQLVGSEVKVQASWPRKKEAALVKTICSHIHNMMTGVSEGFTYKMTTVFSHFPISVKVQGKKVLIENFIGERSARTAKIMGDVKVIPKDDDVIVQGTNIEDVSQTAANIQNATKIRNKDPRKFLDGIYVQERKEGME